MHVIRNAILAGIASIILPMSGVAHHTAQFLINVRDSLIEIAEAAPTRSVDFLRPGIRIRAEASLAAPVRGLGNPGDRAKVHGRIPGQAVTCPDGRTNESWLRITDLRTRVVGYVSACFLPPEPGNAQ